MRITNLRDTNKFIFSYKRVLLKSAMKVIEDRQILIMEKKKNLVQDITQMVVQ